MIQLILMIKDAEDTIQRVIRSWENKVDKIVVYIDNKTTDNTRNLVKNYKTIDFTNFSETRNKCIDKSYNERYEWTIMVDDSYELIGSVNELYYIDNDINCVSIPIRSGNMTYNRRSCFRSRSRIKYVGDIHESLDSTSNHTLKGAFINDIQTKRGKIRTDERIYYDLDQLKSKDDPHSLYLLANISMRLLVKNLTTLGNVINAYEKRLNTKSKNSEETFLTCVILGHLYTRIDKNKAFEFYTKSIFIFPPRQGESYLHLFKLTNDRRYINLAYKYRTPKIHNMPYDSRMVSIIEQLHIQPN